MTKHNIENLKEVSFKPKNRPYWVHKYTGNINGKSFEAYYRHTSGSTIGRGNYNWQVDGNFTRGERIALGKAIEKVS